MDPWLEMHWRDVHSALIIYARDAIQENLPGDLVARVEENLVVDDEDAPREGRIAADVRIAESPLSASWPLVSESESGVAVAEPLLVAEVEESIERHIEIYDRSSGYRLVTAIEVLSLTNKNPGTGRDRYRKKQKEYIAAGVNLVEIDLLRGGEHSVAAPLLTLLDYGYQATYYACVTRAARRGYFEVYPLLLGQRLPAIRIPLRITDPDVPLNLQSLIDDCYRKGRYAATIDYQTPLEPPLSALNREWANEQIAAARPALGQD